MLRAIKEKFRYENGRLIRVQKSYAFRYPHRLYEQKLEQLDKLTEQLVRGTGRLTIVKRGQHEMLHKRLWRNHPSEALRQGKIKFERTQKDLNRAMLQILTKKQTEFDRIISALRILNPLKIMDRGYSLAYTEDNRLVKSVDQVKASDQIQVQLTDGRLFCIVENIKEKNKDGE